MKHLSEKRPSSRNMYPRIVFSTAIGLMTGLAFGVAVHNSVVGVVLGLLIGAGTGAAIDQQHLRNTVDVDHVLWALTPLLVFVVLTTMLWLDILVW